jgi:hypothetical protein
MASMTKASTGDQVGKKSTGASPTSATKLGFLAVPLVAVILLLGVFMSWESAGRYFFANNAASVLRQGGEASYGEVDERFSSANRLAPEVGRYWHERADIEHNRASSTSSQAIRQEARELAYEYDNRAFDANPLEINNHYRLAFSAWELGKLGDNDKKLEALELYERLVKLAPSDSLAAERLATLKEAINQ